MELLVVITVIALLLGILLPGLSRARRQSLAVSCLSRLHQWAIIFSNYTNSNNYLFHRREIGTPGGYKRMWINVYKPYYQDPDMRCCPAATNRLRIEGSYCTWAGEGDDWGWGGDWDPNKSVYGSYGFNRYVIDVVGGWGPKKHCWRRANVKGGDTIPVFMDCMYPAISPSPDDQPPSFEGERSADEQMQFACIDRHLGHVNMVFLDFSVRDVGLKELWTLRWSRDWNTCGEWTKCGGVTYKEWDAAAWWMRRFPIY